MKSPERPKTKRETSLGRYQALLSPVVGEFSLFINEFELLKPTLTDYVQKRYIQNRNILAFQTLKSALVGQCAIHAHQLLAGNGGLDGRKTVRPSLRILVHPFLEKNQEQYAHLLEKILLGPPIRPDLVLHFQKGPVTSALIERVNRQHDKLDERNFFDRLQLVRKHWASLEKEREKLESPRNETFAHLELEPGTIEFTKLNLSDEPSNEIFDAFNFKTRPRLTDLCQIFHAIIPRIGTCLRELIFLLIREDFPVGDLYRHAAHDAEVFWRSQIIR
jgi:hypothetical protein